MRVLITGGAGFIGSSLALDLINAGHEITVLDSLSPQIHGADSLNSPLYARVADKVRFIHGSVSDPSVWPAAISGQQAIIHLAAETGTGQSMYEIHRYSDVNVGGTALMLEHLAKNSHDVGRIVLASTRALYGEGKYRASDGVEFYPEARRVEDLRAGRFELYDPRNGAELQPVATDDRSVLRPSSVYGITKHSQEQLVMTMCPALGIAPVALRYQNVFGPGQSLSNPYTGILSIFSTRILHGRPIAIFEDGYETRDFVFIDDVVAATRAALLQPDAGGEIFGIGSGVPTSVVDAANTLCRHFARNVPIEINGAFRVGDIRHNFADLTKARKLLGYSSGVSFDEGIRRFVEWVMTQPLQQDQYEQSLRELKDKGLMHARA